MTTTVTGAVAGGIDLDLPGSGVRLRATRWPGTGVPVLLLHGLASSRRFWNLVVPGLAGLPVLALDQRGHGESDRPAGPYDGSTIARDALTALDALGLSRAVVVGHSWGGWTAVRLAAEAPERVLAAVAIDGGFRGPMAAGPAARAATRVRLTPPRIALPLEELRAMLRAGEHAERWSPDVERAVLPLFEAGENGLWRARLPFEAHMAILDDLLDSDPMALLPDVACPAWLVSCESLPGPGGPTGDPAVQDKAADLERAAALLRRPRTQRWGGAVHDVPLQWPALVAGLVRAAVAEVAA